MASQFEQSVVKIFVADEQLEMRRLVRTSLNNIRNAEFVEFKEYDSLKSDLEHCYPDLIIADSELAGGDTIKLIRSLRHSDFGMNPFVPVIATTWETKRTEIRKIIDSGVDAILLKPLSSSAIVRMVERLTAHRKSFVVTSNYIGPDRRNDPEREDSAPLIEVPNTLRSKRNGESVDVISLHNWIKDELASVNAERLRSNAVEIIRLISMILPDFANDKVNDRTVSRLNRIKSISDDIGKRMRNEEFEHIATLCDNLGELAGRIGSGKKTQSGKDLKLIGPLCEAILAGIDAGGQGSDIALEIASSVRTN